MKTTFVKTAVLFAMALASIATSSPSFARAHHEYRYGGQEVQVNRQDRPSSIDAIYQPPFKND